MKNTLCVPPAVVLHLGLGVYGLGVSPLSRAADFGALRPLTWDWEPTVWESTVSGYGFWRSPAKHLFLRKVAADPSGKDDHGKE